jgi:transcriptional regulator with XRE-family HTH domain
MTLMHPIEDIDEAVVAKRLRTARRLAGLSQEDAARQLDVSTKTIARWESAETTGFLGELDRIAKVYGTTTEAILGEGDESQMAAQLATLRAELDELRGLLLDPKKLRAAADALIADEVPPARRRKRSK